MPVEFAQTAWLKLDYRSCYGFCNGEISRVDNCERSRSTWHGPGGKEGEFVDEGRVSFQGALGIRYRYVAHVNGGEDEGVFFREIVEYGFIDAKVFG